MLSRTLCAGVQYTVTFALLVMPPKHAVKISGAGGPGCAFRGSVMVL